MLQAPRPDSVIRAHESKPGAGQCLNSCCHNQRERERERERLAVEQPPSHHLGQSEHGQLEIGDFSDASINQAAHMTMSWLTGHTLILNKDMEHLIARVGLIVLNQGSYNFYSERLNEQISGKARRCDNDLNIARVAGCCSFPSGVMGGLRGSYLRRNGRH